jgi:hypothetical protein
MVAQFFKAYASLEVTRQREVATELIFLTGATGAGRAEGLEQGDQSDWSRGSGATTVGGAKRLQQEERSDYCRWSKATTVGGRKRLQQGERSNYSRRSKVCLHFVNINNCLFTFQTVN